MVEINGERLLKSLHDLRQFGRCQQGVVRPMLSKADIQSRYWLRQQMIEAGLDAEIDGLGSVVGRAKTGKAHLLIGSHTDTQPEGGWLDGTLGVMYGIEVVRTLGESMGTVVPPVDVVSWADEEGAFIGCMGSQVYCSELDDDAVRGASNLDGLSMVDAIAVAELSGTPWFRHQDGVYIGYLEAHIEQGPYLYMKDLDIGVVTSIVGVRSLLIDIKGEQNHSGTTPMSLRKDAGAGLIRLAYRINEEFPKQCGPQTVWTIGQIELRPGAESIVPGHARMHLEIRDGDEVCLDRLSDLLRDLAADMGPVEAEISEGHVGVPAATMDEGFLAHIESAAETHASGKWMRMPSGAAHDAQIVARRLPSAMMFVPSIGGISHNFAEDTNEDQIVLGCQVFATAVQSILEGHQLL